MTSGFLQDLIKSGELPESSQNLIIDPKKIHRAREAIMAKVNAAEEQKTEEETIETLLVDAR